MDTNLPNETLRWVFPECCAGLEEVGREVVLPRHFIKLCGTVSALKAALPPAWHLEPQSYFMMAAADGHRAATRLLPEGYELRCDRNGSTTTARVITPDGGLAASGHATEAVGVFIYDRIVTAPEHQRKGLGNVIMNVLKGQRQSEDAPELLVATEEGCGLYTSMGWRIISPFSTAFIPG
ncbi:GNAT family N-acetyltransferase [Sphingopyxis sp. R3-92]|uniref:GNAT family N-acetyltransferase n=1 Tax=Sphingopyxis sp. R3-92 TaxID=3158553 RepID=UPI003EE6F2A1